MSAMAEAVENSEFIIMCMSPSYKQSTYCQAEAEYAFNCKRRIVPLLLKADYRADGWLGFLLGVRIYVDFGRYEFTVACDNLMKEIQLQRKRPLPSKVGTAVTSHDIPVVKAEDPPPVEVKPAVKKYTSRIADTYLKRVITTDFEQKSREEWTESDVLDFLGHHQLHEFMPLCEKMDGQALIHLAKMCIDGSHQTYDLLNRELKANFDVKMPISTYTRFVSIMETMSKEESVPCVPPVIQPPMILPLIIQPTIIQPTMIQPMMIRPPMPRSLLPYDILITSNAPASHMISLAQQILPSLSKIRQRSLFYQ
jgi:hypothetical protein